MRLLSRSWAFRESRTAAQRTKIGLDEPAHGGCQSLNNMRSVILPISGQTHSSRQSCANESWSTRNIDHNISSTITVQRSQGGLSVHLWYFGCATATPLPLADVNHARSRCGRCTDRRQSFGSVLKSELLHNLIPTISKRHISHIPALALQHLESTSGCN